MDRCLLGRLIDRLAPTCDVIRIFPPCDATVRTNVNDERAMTDGNRTCTVSEIRVRPSARSSTNTARAPATFNIARWATVCVVQLAVVTAAARYSNGSDERQPTDPALFTRRACVWRMIPQTEKNIRKHIEKNVERLSHHYTLGHRSPLQDPNRLTTLLSRDAATLLQSAACYGNSVCL